MDEQINKYFTDELSLKEKDQLLDQINASEEEKKEYARMQISVALSSMAPHERGGRGGFTGSVPGKWRNCRPE